KDRVIFGALEHQHPVMAAVGIITACMKAYYMCRLLFITFLGSYRGDVDPSDLGIRHPELAGTPHADDLSHSDHHDHGPQWAMNIPVAILIVPTVLIGWLMAGGENSPWNHFFAQQFPHPVLPPAPLNEAMTGILTLLVVIVGIAIAYWRYATATAQANAVARL